MSGARVSFELVPFAFVLAFLLALASNRGIGSLLNEFTTMHLRSHGPLQSAHLKDQQFLSSSLNISLLSYDGTLQTVLRLTPNPRALSLRRRTRTSNECLYTTGIPELLAVVAMLPRVAFWITERRIPLLEYTCNEYALLR